MLQLFLLFQASVSIIPVAIVAVSGARESFTPHLQLVSRSNGGGLVSGDYKILSLPLAPTVVEESKQRAATTSLLLPGSNGHLRWKPSFERVFHKQTSSSSGGAKNKDEYEGAENEVKHDETDEGNEVNDIEVQYIRAKPAIIGHPYGVWNYNSNGNGHHSRPINAVVSPHAHRHSLGFLDPIFLLLSLSFVFFLINSILGVADHGKAAFQREGELSLVEENFNNAMSKYKVKS